MVKLLNAVSILSAYYNKQACSPPPWDTQSLAGYYPSAFRSWKSAFISQRAGPSDSAALYLLSSGQRRRQFSSVWISPPGHTKAWGGVQLTIFPLSDNLQLIWFSHFLCCYSPQVLNSALGKQVFKIKRLQVRTCPPHRKSPRRSSPPMSAPRSLSKSPVRKHAPSKRGDHAVAFCSCNRLHTEMLQD